MQGRIVPRESKKYQSFPFKNWQHELKQLKKLNLKMIEWVVCSYDKKNPILNSEGIKQILVIKKKHKFKINSVTVDYLMDYPFFKKENFLFKKEILKNLKEIILNCNKVGIKLIILPFLETSTIKNKKEENTILENLKNFIPLLKKTKQKILFEIDMKPQKVYSFIKKFNSKYFGINYDSGNSAGLNYNILDEKKYFKYVKNIHIKDKLKYGKTIRLGFGDVNFQLLFKTFQKFNYKGNFILQTARSRKNQLLEIKRNLKYIIHINH